MKPSGIGGQAVMEGVMMKNGDKYAVAVRKPNKEISVEVKTATSISKKYPIFKFPILRGIAAFAESLSLGMSSLTYSASFYEEEEEESKFEKKLNQLTKGKAESVMSGMTVVMAIVLALGIFVLLPMLLAGLLGKVIESQILLAVLEGVFRVAIFVAYIVLISCMQDVRRLFMYHGAEHKTINCIEHGLPLTYANVKKQSREHKRCGTSFMLTVMLISVIFFMFVRVGNPFLRLVVRLLLIPVIAGVSYEFIRYAGKHDSAFINILSRPGMWLQALTTKEPDRDMIEVAIQSVEAVFDWKTFIEEDKKKTGKKSKNQKEKKAEPVQKIQEEAVQEKPVQEAPAEEVAVQSVAEPEVMIPEEAMPEEVAPEVAVSEETMPEETMPEAEVQEQVTATAETEEKPVAEVPVETPAAPLEIDIAQLFDIKLDTASSNQTKTKSKSTKATPKTTPKKDPIPEATRAVSAMKDEEDDDILKALDMYFEFHGEKSVMEISDEVQDDENA